MTETPSKGIKDFDDFRASRERVDPSSKSMSDHQWKQAYSAYVSSRERMLHAGERDRTRGRRRRTSRSRGMAVPSALSDTTILRMKVREDSAYEDLRLLLDVASWIIVGLVALTAVIKVFAFSGGLAPVIALVAGIAQVLAVLIVRLVVHAIIDIPDIAIHRELTKQAEAPQESEETE